MIAVYTETLEEYITQGGNLHKEKFDLLPTFTVGDTVYNVYDLFIQRYKLREIGLETAELFDHYLNMKLDEVNVRYANKVKMYIKAFDNLLDRKLDVRRDIMKKYDGINDVQNYLNPISTQSAYLQDKQSNSANTTEHIAEDNQKIYGYFKSNPKY